MPLAGALRPQGHSAHECRAAAHRGALLIDADGILQVSAREQRSGQAAQIEVKPTYGLTDEQVESMILDSFDHAEEDFAKRLLIEARNEAETILAAVERAPQSPAWTQLPGEEQAAIAAARDLLAVGQEGEISPRSARRRWRSTRPRAALPS